VKLRERLAVQPKPAPGPRETGPIAIARPAAQTPDPAHQDLKFRIHRELLDRVDLASLARVDLDEMNAELEAAIRQLIDEQALPLSQRDRDRLADEILSEVKGLGPIEPLMRDPEVTDILVNTARKTYVERRGRLELTPVTFRDDAHLLQIIDRIVSRVGRRIDESSPMVDARLPDGSRVNAIIPPLALDGPLLSIRRFGKSPLTVDDLLHVGALTPQMLTVLRAMVRARLNILISGGTGSGKTTLLNCLSSFIPESERIITIEDSAELQLQQPHVGRLETRPSNIEGRGEVTQRDLVKNCLRMRPDRIILGEVRGAEALDMLQAMNTGHDGSISTVHANSPRDALARLEMMIQMSGVEIPMKAMRQQIASAIDLIVQTQRMADGSRKVVSVSEVDGMEGDIIVLQDLFAYRIDGMHTDGNVTGRFDIVAARPRFIDRMKASSHQVDPDVLECFSR
jgi:pilus assembly protein CpaF